MCQEPWCFHPDQIATLTDFQIEWLYLRPAAERSGRTDPAPAPAERTREGYIRAGQSLFGGSADDWGRKWDEAKARDEQARQRPDAAGD